MALASIRKKDSLCYQLKFVIAEFAQMIGAETSAKRFQYMQADNIKEPFR